MAGNYVRTDAQLIAQVLNKLPRELYDSFITAIESIGCANLSMDQFDKRLRGYWTRSVRGRSDHVTMAMETPKPPVLPAVASVPSPVPDVGNMAITNLQEQVKSLADLLNGIRMDQQRRDPAAWGVTVCTLCGSAGHEVYFCRSGGRGQGNTNYGQMPSMQSMQQPMMPMICFHCQ